MPPPTTTEKISGFFSIFIPVEGYFITPILINFNILVFIIMVILGVDFIAPTSENLINGKYILLGKGKKNNYILIIEL